MRARLKKIPRRRLPGQLAVEQTHDAAVVAAMLKNAGAAVPAGFTEHGECYLVAYWGDQPVGIAGIETEVDTALMRPLFVLENMRRRRIGARLLAAVRQASRTRGARTLYAIVPASSAGYFARLGFVETNFAEVVTAFGHLSMFQRACLDGGLAWRAVQLDISREGLIER
jgi:N-acetylglutamate synthase-like GNAT family acetyltransferase